jgi:GT2 family glycosyltransferase
VTDATCSIGTVVVNWNNPSDTVDCLESLHVASPRPPRVVVVDNGSVDDSPRRIAQWAAGRGISCEFIRGLDETTALEAGATSPWLTIASVGKNLGFAGGNNVGLALLYADATLKNFLLLNNDAVVAPNYFQEMRAALQTTPSAGLTIGTIYQLPDRERVWYAGGRMLPLRALVAHNVDLPVRSEPARTEFITGCAMVIGRDALDRVGLLAECYFPGYMEDAEYSLRVSRSGLDLIYAPRALVYHKVGATFGARSTSPATAYFQTRHRLFFARRNLHGASLLVALIYMATTKPARALVDVLCGRLRVGWATLRGTVAGFLMPAGDRPRYLQPPHRGAEVALTRNAARR